MSYVAENPSVHSEPGWLVTLVEISLAMRSAHKIPLKQSGDHSDTMSQGSPDLTWSTMLNSGTYEDFRNNALLPVPTFPSKLPGSHLSPSGLRQLTAETRADNQGLLTSAPEGSLR
jgi:hypothetical protein